MKSNGRDVPNVGLTGVESIRIGGMTMETMPMREAAVTKEQWPMVEESALKQKIANIRGEYPTQRIDYLQSRIVEAECNITRIRGLVDGQNTMINDYSMQIGLCAHRDKEIAKLDADKDADKIKDLKLQFPPYNVDAMQQQITQCKEAIDRSDKVIDTEYSSISELKDTIALCRIRDERLKQCGVDLE